MTTVTPLPVPEQLSRPVTPGNKIVISRKCQGYKPDHTACTAPSAYYVEFLYGEAGGRSVCGKHLTNAIHDTLGANGDALGAVRVRPIPETD